MRTIRALPMNTSSIGWNRGSAPRGASEDVASEVEGQADAGLFETGLQHRELGGEFRQLFLVELLEDEFLDRLVLLVEARQVLLRLLGQGQPDLPCVGRRRATAQQGLLLEQLGLCGDERRIDVEEF